MPSWEKATIVSKNPGGKLTVTGAGVSYIKILSPKFRLNDGTNDHSHVGFGTKVIE